MSSELTESNSPQETSPAVASSNPPTSTSPGANARPGASSGPAASVYPAGQFALLRVALGLYLTLHFASLLPWSAELWSNAGALPEASSNLTSGYFPNLLAWFDDPIVVRGFVAAAIGLSVALTSGRARPWVALLLWYMHACLFHRNNLTLNPGLPFVGWLLLLMVVVPAGEPWVLGKRGREAREGWEFPRYLFAGGWLIMGLSYTVSGLDKWWNSPSWQAGEALRFVLEAPMARDTALRTWLLEQPGLLAMGSWAALLGELFFLPLCLHRRGRALVWGWMVAMHLGMVVIFSFLDMSASMLLFHLFTFDRRWLDAWRADRGSTKDTTI